MQRGQLEAVDRLRGIGRRHRVVPALRAEVRQALAKICLQPYIRTEAAQEGVIATAWHFVGFRKEIRET